MRSRPHPSLASAVFVLVLALAPAGAAAPPVLAPLSDAVAFELPEPAIAAPSPAELLGYPLGARFTHHHRILDYFEALAAASPRVRLAEYGTTYEGRPLVLATIASERLHARLDAVRQGNLRLADPRTLAAGDGAALVAEQPVVVWLAYGVHGNEASSAEAAMLTAWVLATAGGDVAEMLEKTVVVLDPLVNPDGRERYVSWYETQRGMEPDPLPQAAEHWEPWPGGRQNHYLLDLNRDWAWASQRETRQRLAAYRAWEPQVYVDFHEMSPRSTYFFPPPAEPVHPELDAGVLAWLDVFGRANASAFDRFGWTYYVREVFDLFYPGYGDTYPGLRGAVGMTYEMAGGGRAGQLLHLAGRELSLADRVARHATTGLETVETAAANRGELLASFLAARRPPTAASARTYLWPADQPEARALADLLALHGVEVGVLAADATVDAAPVGVGAIAERRLPAGSFAVSSAQPLGRLVRALMEPRTAMPERFLDEQRQRIEESREPEFFDVTAWSLPLAYNLEAFHLDGPPPRLLPVPPRAGAVDGDGAVGFVMPPQGLAGYRLVASLLAEETRLRVALEPFTLGGEDLAAGTVFVPRRGNPDDLGERLAARAAEEGVRLRRVASSLSDAGPALGSEAMLPVRPPRIGLLGGEGTSVTSFGFAWHLLDEAVAAPVSRLDVATLGELQLSRFDVLVLPDGDGWGDAVDDETAERLAEWLRGGGVLVAIGDAGKWLRERELTEVEAWEPEEPADDEKAPGRAGGDDAEEGTLGSRELLTPGAIVATETVRRHPFLVGLPSPPPVLFYGSRVLVPTGKSEIDLLRVADEPDPVLGGFAWPEARDRLRGALLVAVEEVGRGRVVLFAQEPAFRLFWRGTAPIFLNAVLYGPSLTD